MNRMEVVVVTTGTANTASVLAGLSRAGATARLTTDPKDVLSAPRVVLPGVGAFAAAMNRLNLEDLVEPLRERIRSGAPTLTICLGLQLLAKGSEESPGTEGLGVVDCTVTRLPETVRVPQIGWNLVEPDPSCKLLQRGYAYFANSYCIKQRPASFGAALTDHGGPFVAALERGQVVACQFHPELSGQWGLSLLRRWLEASCQTVGASC